MNIDEFDPFETFLSLKLKHPHAFFFESKDFSVIGLDYDEVIRVVGGQVLRVKDGLTQELQVNFLEYLSMKLKSFGEGASDFPYQNGGAFGCMGYEIVGMLEPRLMKTGYFEKLHQAQEVLAEIFISKNLIVFDRPKKKIHFALKNLKVKGEEFQKYEQCPSISKKQMPESFDGIKAMMGLDQFQKNVKIIKSHIRAGDIFQAVLSERFELKSNASPLNVYSSVKRQCPSAYSYYFDFQESTFFGASPETLVKSTAGILETHPIAGTRPRGSDEKHDQLMERQLKRSSKEGSEHLMLVDLARNDLGRVSKPGTIRVEIFRKLLRLNNVMHLVSVVKGEKADKSNLEALSACFPAGTLSGAPKVRAMEILSGIESRPRGLYGGAVVAFDPGGDLDSCIAIRSVEMKGQVVILRAGAGIVADSKPENEYQEIKHKLQALLNAVKGAEVSAITKVIA